MTCVAQAAQRLPLQLMTANYGFQLGGTLKATPPCWIMLFVQPQYIVIWLKLCKIGCMMCNFTPDVHGEVHIWHLDTMQHGIDGPKNTLNGLVRIGNKFYSQMSVACCFNQTIVRCFWRKSGQAERLRHCPASAARWWFPEVLGWHYVGANVRNWWSWKALKRLYDTGMTSSDVYRNHIGRIARVLMDDSSCPHHAHLVNVFFHDNNIARLEWPACSSDMNPIDHVWDILRRAVFGRDDPPTTLRDLCRFAVEEWDNLD